MKYYRIDISGRGGEVVFGKATLQQYNFWNDPEYLMDAGFDEGDEGDALVYYMVDKEEWEENIPKMARFDYDWYEIDEYGHFNGATVETAYIEINEVDSSEWNATIIKEIYEGTLEKLLLNNEDCVTETELNLDDELEDKPPFVFYAMSVEKGLFFSGVIELEDEIDINKLKFYVDALPTSDNIISSVEYNNEDISNYGGDTTGKGLYMEVWEW